MKSEYQTLSNGALVEIIGLGTIPNEYMLVVDGEIITLGKYSDIIWTLNTIQESVDGIE